MIQCTYPFLEKYSSLFAGGPVRDSVEDVAQVAGSFKRFEIGKEKLVLAKKISLGFAGISAAALAVTIIASLIIGGAFWPIPALILLLSLASALTNWQAEVYIKEAGEDLIPKTFQEAKAKDSARLSNITGAQEALLSLEQELITAAGKAPDASSADDDRKEYDENYMRMKTEYITNFNYLNQCKENRIQNILNASKANLLKHRVIL